jgi:hypothetical protein
MRAVTIAVLIFLSYTTVAVNTIALSKARYVPTFISGTLFVCVNFFLIKHVAEAASWTEFIGYLIGGVCGDAAGIYISKRVNI